MGQEYEKCVSDILSTRPSCHSIEYLKKGRNRKKYIYFKIARKCTLYNLVANKKFGKHKSKIKCSN